MVSLTEKLNYKITNIESESTTNTLRYSESEDNISNGQTLRQKSRLELQKKWNSVKPDTKTIAEQKLTLY